jgi:hypothetical protein
MPISKKRKLEVGAIYLFKHSRKGTFKAKVLEQSVDRQFADLCITEGKAEGRSVEWNVGDTLFLRLDLCETIRKERA